MSMSKSGITAAVLAVLSLVVASAFTTRSGLTGTIYFGMDAPLTGATQLVGQSDRDAVQSIVAYWNAHGGIKGKEVVVDVLDNASNPSQAVQNVQRFIGDSKYVGILGSGNAAAAVATGPLASQAGIPFIALSPPTNLIEPPQPYVYILTATSRLYAYNEAAYLRKLGIKKVWLMGDNGGFGRDGPTQVQKLASKYGLQIVDTTIFSPASTDFTAELTKVKDSGAQALWLWTATPAGATIVKQFKQLQLPQQLVLTGANLSESFLQGPAATSTARSSTRSSARRGRSCRRRAPCGRPCGRRRRCCRRCSDAPSPTSTPTPPWRSGRSRRRSRRAGSRGRRSTRARDQDQRSRHAGRPHPALQDESRGCPAPVDVGREDPSCKASRFRNGVRLKQLSLGRCRRRLRGRLRHRRPRR